MIRGPIRLALGTTLAAGLVIAPISALPAWGETPAASGAGVVINEAYTNGGSSGAAYKNKFVELYNSNDADVQLSGWSVQYRSSTGAGAPNGVLPLTGSIKAHGYYLVGGGSNGSNGADLPTPDARSGNLNFKGTDGTIVLAKTDSAISDLPTGSVTGNPQVADLLGYGTSNTFETAPAPAPKSNSDVKSIQRGGADTDNNSTDFATSAAITPQNAAGTTGPSSPPADPTDPPTGPTDPPTPGDPTPINQIQGEGNASPLAGKNVTTTGVVTAVYPTGGLNGYYIQTEGTGGDLDLAGHKASDAVFIYSPDTVKNVQVGQNVQVTGGVSEYPANSPTALTEINVAAAGLKILDTAAQAVKPADIAVPADAAQRESLEGMLIQPTGQYTITDNYSAINHGQFSIAAGDKPLLNPNSVAPYGSAEHTALTEENANAALVLDDGATTDFSNPTNKNIPLPWLSESKPMRVGTPLTFTKAAVLDQRFNSYELIPTTALTTDNDGAVNPVSSTSTRMPGPAAVGGNLRISSYNVENFFTDLGNANPNCQAYTDKDGNGTNVKGGCDQRGAWDAAALGRQLNKITAGINALGADVVSLEEIENSARFGQDRDASLKYLVDHLNQVAGSQKWAFVPSPAKVPADEDVIRTAFIYQKGTVQTVGDAQILDDPSFTKLARQPQAQWFKRAGDSDAAAVLAVVNHFKSKGSTGAGSDSDQGQGAYNKARTKQAKALTGWIAGLRKDKGNDKAVLLGDFNAYSFEDPILAITAAGYADLDRQAKSQSYVFQGRSGSLDHVLVSPELAAQVTGIDVWNVNSVESVAFNYTRFNGNATNFYSPDAYAASDHDPVVLGLNLGSDAAGSKTLNLLNINDFHGRIDSNTVKFAGTVEQLKAEDPQDSALLSAGDNVGASLFASSIAGDQPTIDVLNALDLKASAVGNHEFDKGFSDLTDRIIGPADARNAKFDYLGANVYARGTTKPLLPEYKMLTINGVKVAVIGTVTQETASLVSPSGISNLEFGDPVEATNRVVKELQTGADKPDVIVAEIHDGATEGVKDGASEDEEVAAGGGFAEIVQNTDPAVAAIFTGHTHKEYAWDAPIPGAPGKTRPVLQTGSYGENVGQIKLTLDANNSVTSYQARNVPRLTADDAGLVAKYPRVAEVKKIVDAALASAAEQGNKPLGKITADVTTAFIGDKRDDRMNASTLGAMVADSISWRLNTPYQDGTALNGGPVDFSVVNPGGLRSDLLYQADPAHPGQVTLAQANAVLPFANTIVSTTLTGAQVKTMLEQQWQPDGASRPYLALGVSKGMSFTYDPAAAKGSHITSVVINGKPLDDSTKYRVGMQSFLAAGGDNFTEIAKGTDAKDSGVIDSDSWYQFIEANQKAGLSPDFAERGVAVSGAPAAVQPGAQVSVKLSKLDLTSLGAPASKSVTVRYDPSGIGLGKGFSVPSAAVPAELGSAPVATGEATLNFTAPAQLNGGRFVVTTDTGTVARLPISVPVAGSTEPGNGNGTGPGTGPGDGGNGNGSTAPGDGSGAGNGSGSGHGGNGAGGSGSGLASTGFDPFPIGAGVLALLAGLVAVLVASRRRTSPAGK